MIRCTDNDFGTAHCHRELVALVFGPLCIHVSARLVRSCGSGKVKLTGQPTGHTKGQFRSKMGRVRLGGLYQV